MTIWKAGMLAVCVRGGPRDKDEVTGLYAGPDGFVLAAKSIYRVKKIIAAVDGSGRVGLLLEGMPGSGWFSDRFRPLNDAEQDADLIAKIKRYKPARQPVEA